MQMDTCVDCARAVAEWGFTTSWSMSKPLVLHSHQRFTYHLAAACLHLFLPGHHCQHIDKEGDKVLQNQQEIDRIPGKMGNIYNLKPHLACAAL